MEERRLCISKNHECEEGREGRKMGERNPSIGGRREVGRCIGGKSEEQ